MAALLRVINKYNNAKPADAPVIPIGKRYPSLGNSNGCDNNRFKWLNKIQTWFSLSLLASLDLRAAILFLTRFSQYLSSLLFGGTYDCKDHSKGINDIDPAEHSNNVTLSNLVLNYECQKTYQSSTLQVTVKENLHHKLRQIKEFPFIELKQKIIFVIEITFFYLIAPSRYHSIDM